MQLLDPEDLHGAISFARSKTCKSGGKTSGGSFAGFLPSFYGVGAFNPILVRGNARSTDQQLATLETQLIAERVRYLVKHLGEASALRKNLSIFLPLGEDKFPDRFDFGLDVSFLFTKARKAAFPKSKRSPVGLNPERFVETCELCETYLTGEEFGTKLCVSCTHGKMKDDSSLNIDPEEAGSMKNINEPDYDEKEELRATIAAQAKEIKNLKEALAKSKVEIVDLTEEEGRTPVKESSVEKPQSQLAFLHEQALALAEVKKEAIDRAATAEKRVEDVMLQLECPICFGTKENSTALGCGHVISSDCVEEHATDACPTCRKPVESRITLYK